MNRVGLGKHARDDGVTRLVIGGVSTLFFGHHDRAALGAHDDLVLGALEIDHLDQAGAATGGKQRRLIHQVGQIGAGKTGCAAGDYITLDVGSDRNLAHVHAQDLLATTDIGQRHHDLTVKAARTQQRRVEHVGPVGCCNHDDALTGLETVHLDQ